MNRFAMLGRLSSQPGKRSQLIAHLLEAAAMMREAPGCELYVVFASAGDPDGLWVVESWRSQADHEASLLLPGVKELIARARPLIATMHEPVGLVPQGGHGLPVG